MSQCRIEYLLKFLGEFNEVDIDTLKGIELTYVVELLVALEEVAGIAGLCTAPPFHATGQTGGCTIAPLVPCLPGACRRISLRNPRFRSILHSRICIPDNNCKYEYGLDI